jgi:hypothetical protein
MKKEKYESNILIIRTRCPADFGRALFLYTAGYDRMARGVMQL